MSDYTPKAFYDSPTDNVGLRVAFEKFTDVTPTEEDVIVELYKVDQRKVPNFYVTGFSSEDGILILRTNLVQFLELVKCGIFAKLSYVCNIINETIVENNVNVFEDIPQEIKDQLQEYMVGPTWLKPTPFGFSIDIRDASEMHGGFEKNKKLYPSGGYVNFRRVDKPTGDGRIKYIPTHDEHQTARGTGFCVSTNQFIKLLEGLFLDPVAGRSTRRDYVLKELEMGKLGVEKANSNACEEVTASDDPFAEAERLETYALHKKASKDKSSDEFDKVNLFQEDHMELCSKEKGTCRTCQLDMSVLDTWNELHRGSTVLTENHGKSIRTIIDDNGWQTDRANGSPTARAGPSTKSMVVKRAFTASEILERERKRRAKQTDSSANQPE